MSFYMEAMRDGLDWDRVQQLVDDCGGTDVLPIEPWRRSLFGGRPRKLFIIDSFEGESLLSDDADWDASTWAMRPEALPALEATVRCLCRHIPEGFDFVAAWVGDRIRHEVHVSCQELIDIVRRSALNGKTRYVVRP